MNVQVFLRVFLSVYICLYAGCAAHLTCSCSTMLRECHPEWATCESDAVGCLADVCLPACLAAAAAAADDDAGQGVARHQQTSVKTGLPPFVLHWACD